VKRLLCLLIFSASLANAEPRPNFVVIMVDDMGYAGVSCFGNPYFKTPEIDRLAAEGMRLTDFHSSGAVCSEKTNLARAEPDRAAAMLTRLKAWYNDTQRTATPQPGGWPR
jgi:arylsulfatase A-like enzyme